MAQSGLSNWTPLAAGERLTFTLLWPSGIPLGEATLHASAADGKVHLEVEVTADLPQHHASYFFDSLADEQLCSLRFSETMREGSKVHEAVYEFHQAAGKVIRTSAGQSTERPAPACARDPLAFLYYFRRHLATNPPPKNTSQSAGTFLLEGEYSVQYQASAAETVKLGMKPWEGERFQITARNAGPGQSFEVWLRLDEARTPVAVRVPFSLATFSAELQ